MTKIKKGSCACGSIHYEIRGELRPVCYCHCNQCRKMSGHFVAATQCDKKDLTVHGELTWFQSSETARRAFCGTCGSHLFWEPTGGERISIFAGALDGDTSDITADSQIWCEAKGEYYELPDVPQIDQGELRR